MRLDLRFTPRAPYTLWCEAVAGFIYKEFFVKDEGLAGVDHKTSAYLRLLNKRGFFKADPGELLLLPGEGRLKADKVIVKGLGIREELTLKAYLGHALELGLAIRSMGIGNFAVKIPVLFGVERYLDQIEKSVCEIISPFLEHEHDNEESVITAVFCLERSGFEEIEKLDRPLKERFTPLVPFSMVVEPFTGPGEI